ncbi:hypothetical protein [Clostridium sp. CF012]|uniref:hypothetical protein n=1 Tax=Clostridium sp. CF012 TaxID=2843319 RepID=UPI001C0C66C8|nr:hypothetical protein [Clostridium sp. CF012]MBU3146660.1 hypothetical protein [Clostridium sp. CF012]
MNAIKLGQGNAIESNVLTSYTFTNADGTLRTGTAPKTTINAAVPSGGYDGDYWIQP